MVLDSNEKSFELRSESVRNIVGQIPPTLIRYGIVVVVLVLFVLIGVASFVPYCRVICGTATIAELPKPSADSVRLQVQLTMPAANVRANFEGCSIDLKSPNFTINGRILSFNYQRNVVGNNCAEILISSYDIKSIKPSNVDFCILQKHSSVLQYLFWKKS